jgi:hypothetical protein
MLSIPSANVALEYPVLFDYPVILLTDEGLEDGRRDVGVIIGAQGVAQIG